MLGPILCGLISQAPLIPKLRGHFAEFLNNASSVGFRILSSSTCVGLRYGYNVHYSGFSRQPAHQLRYFYFAPHHVFRFIGHNCLYDFAVYCSPVSAFHSVVVFLVVFYFVLSIVLLLSLIHISKSVH